MEIKKLQDHRNKLIQQRQGILAQKALIQTNLDMLQGAIQSTNILIEQAKPKE
jgi:hypothetical protein